MLFCAVRRVMELIKGLRGEDFLELAANATTGYEWMMQPGTDETILQLQSSRYQGPGDTGAVGQGGTQVFVFEAVGVGTTSVLIHYQRSWETGAPADQHEQVVSVND